MFLCECPPFLSFSSLPPALAMARVGGSPLLLLFLFPFSFLLLQLPFSLVFCFKRPCPPTSSASAFTVLRPYFHYPLLSTSKSLPFLTNRLLPTSISYSGLLPIFIHCDFVQLKRDFSRFFGKVCRAPGRVFTLPPSLLLVGFFPLVSFYVWWQTMSC